MSGSPGATPSAALPRKARDRGRGLCGAGAEARDAGAGSRLERRPAPSCPRARSRAYRRGAGPGVRKRSARASARGACDEGRDRWRGARRARVPAFWWRAPSGSRCGQGASGLTWSGVTGDTPPQSLMPAPSERGELFGSQIGRRLDVHRWAEDQAGDRDGPELLLERRLAGASAMRVPGLARKFWMMTSWMWPCRSWRSRMASSASMRSARVSPMPIRMPRGEGDAGAPGRLDGGEAHGRQLVGRAEMRSAALRQALRGRLQHDALRRPRRRAGAATSLRPSHPD